MQRLAIVDDDGEYREEIKRMLSSYEKEFGETFMVTEYTDGDELVENYASDLDIILLDVKMRFMDGMSAAEEIRKVDSDVIIVFITSTPQYAIKGYQVDALDYILKPIEYYPFSQTIKRAIGRRNTSDKRFLVVNIKGGKQKVDVEDIRYIEVINHDLIIHSINGDIHTKGTMRSMEEELSDADFFQCNKGYLINLAYVEGIKGSDVVVGDEMLQVSRAKKKPLIDAMNKYMRKMGR